MAFGGDLVVLNLGCFSQVSEVNALSLFTFLHLAGAGAPHQEHGASAIVRIQEVSMRAGNVTTPASAAGPRLLLPA